MNNLPEIFTPNNLNLFQALSEQQLGLREMAAYIHYSPAKAHQDLKTLQRA